MKNLLTFLIFSVIIGFDVLDVGHNQSLFVIHYTDRPDDKLLVDNKYLKNKSDIVHILDDIIKQRNGEL